MGEILPEGWELGVGATGQVAHSDDGLVRVYKFRAVTRQSDSRITVSTPNSTISASGADALIARLKEAAAIARAWDAPAQREGDRE
jgi:hypothetical protein